MRDHRSPPPTTNDASTSAPASGSHAYSPPAHPVRTTSVVSGFTTTAYASPFATATDRSIVMSVRTGATPSSGTNRPVHTSAPHPVTVITPCTRPLDSSTCCAVPHDAHTPDTTSTDTTSTSTPSRTYGNTLIRFRARRERAGRLAALERWGVLVVLGLMGKRSWP